MIQSFFDTMEIITGDDLLRMVDGMLGDRPLTTAFLSRFPLAFTFLRFDDLEYGHWHDRESQDWCLTLAESYAMYPEDTVVIDFQHPQRYFGLKHTFPAAYMARDAPHRQDPVFGFGYVLTEMRKPSEHTQEASSARSPPDHVMTLKAQIRQGKALWDRCDPKSHFVPGDYLGIDYLEIAEALYKRAREPLFYQTLAGQYRQHLSKQLNNSQQATSGLRKRLAAIEAL